MKKEKNVEESVLNPNDIKLEDSDTQLTEMQRTFLQDILDAGIITIPHVVLLERVASELRAALSGPRPHNPH
jgi:hypothetical protein